MTNTLQILFQVTIKEQRTKNKQQTTNRPKVFQQHLKIHTNNPRPYL
jgi:hypothetical protein